MNPEFENLFERCFEPGSVSGYMDRLCTDIVTRLAAKGIVVNTIIRNGNNFILQITDYRHRTGIFQVLCVDNSIIEWRRYA
ncbi:hypothetical protein B7N40_24130 [Salmonella enterica subsp. enterica serovar Bovismorbificans]|uniref:Uncharacterized protein n=1 Tax=Salmonella phage vB_STmST313_KE31 TaxID=3161181 RepID=A0AAU8GM71_9CAUD|nr:hypothetical protein [Salmonella enterica subsp. enterica serovar Bovismorbificans]QOI58282.1 hypothetical protein pSal_SNUABM02_049 [Salmonella phage pSal-SNUABM-02]